MTRQYPQGVKIRGLVTKGAWIEIDHRLSYSDTFNGIKNTVQLIFNPRISVYV